MFKRIPGAVLAISLLSVVAFGNVLLVGCVASHQQESTGQYMDSSVITTKVKARLLNDRYVKGLPITVITYKNIVQLSGFVDSMAQKQRAGMLAASVPNVISVENNLVVKKH